MKSLITGSNGAAAYYLAQTLDECHGLARPQTDLTDYVAVCERLDEVRPDVIYHLASFADVRSSFDQAQRVIRNNVEGTVNLFEACRHLNIKPYIQVCSTSEVYGNPGRYPITEDFPIQPVNPYAVSKACQDLLGSMYETCYDFNVVRTRAFGYINPRRGDLSLSSFARQIVEIESGRRSTLNHGNLHSIRTFCDVRDIAEAYKAAVGLSGAYNIGSEKAISIGDCLDILISLSTVPIRKVSDQRLSRPYDVTNQIPDCSKFLYKTGWTPKIPLQESLRWLLNSYRQSHSQN